MDSSNSLMVVDRPGRFARPGTTSLAPPTSTSPMVLQILMQSIDALNHKVDALATRTPQPMQVRPVEVKPAETEPQAGAPEKKLDRAKLRDIFD